MSGENTPASLKIGRSRCGKEERLKGNFHASQIKSRSECGKGGNGNVKKYGVNELRQMFLDFSRARAI